MSSFPNRTLVRAVATVALAACAASTASAASIKAELSKVGSNTWDAVFTVEADPGQTIDAFSINFDWAQVSKLMVQASPGDWDSIAIQADSALAADGLFDSLALGTGIPESTNLGGFVARFDWADLAGPASFLYTINDPISFSPIESGHAQLTFIGNPSPIPEPMSWALLVAGLLATTSTRYRFQRSWAV